MKTIWKFHVEPYDDRIEMPKGAVIRSVGLQATGMVVWAELDDQNAFLIETHRLQVIPTGGEVPEGMRFVGTAQLPLGTVWHVYAEPLA